MTEIMRSECSALFEPMFVYYWVHRGIRDGRTCPVCDRLIDNSYRVEDNPEPPYDLPVTIHEGCRCRWEQHLFAVVPDSALDRLAEFEQASKDAEKGRDEAVQALQAAKNALPDLEQALEDAKSELEKAKEEVEHWEELVEEYWDKWQEWVEYWGEQGGPTGLWPTRHKEALEKLTEAEGALDNAEMEVYNAEAALSDARYSVMRAEHDLDEAEDKYSIANGNFLVAEYCINEYRDAHDGEFPRLIKLSSGGYKMPTWDEV